MTGGSHEKNREQKENNKGTEQEKNRKHKAEKHTFIYTIVIINIQFPTVIKWKHRMLNIFIYSKLCVCESEFVAARAERKKIKELCNSRRTKAGPSRRWGWWWGGGVSANRLISAAGISHPFYNKLCFQPSQLMSSSQQRKKTKEKLHTWNKQYFLCILYYYYNGNLRPLPYLQLFFC